MRHLLFLVVMAIATQIQLRAEWVHLHASVFPGEEGELVCNYNYNNLQFEVLDNKDNIISLWNNCLKALPQSTYVNGFYHQELTYPDSILYNQERFQIISIGDILKRSLDVIKIHFPYELRFIDEEALEAANDYNPDLSSLSFPPAVSRIGKYAVSNCDKITEMIWNAPFPPLCQVSTGEYLGVEDDLVITNKTPFYRTARHCSLVVPKGSLFFYENHPGFFGFKETKELDSNDGWRKYNVKIEGADLEVAYVGNAEVVITKVTPVNGVSALTIPSQVNAADMKCTVIGIGYEAFAGLTLQSVTMPDYLIFVCDNAFKGSAIRELTLPSGCLYAGYKAFADMKNLTKVRLMATKKPCFARDSFEGLPSGVKLETVTSFDTRDEPWRSFSSIEVLPPSGIVSINADGHDGAKYTLRGIPVENPGKGEIIIVNGKKYINR